MDSTDRAVFVMGLVLFVGSVLGGIKQVLFIRRANKSRGAVIHIGANSISSSSSDGGSREMTIEFSCEKGTDYQLSTNITDFKNYYEGQEVQILYDKNDPNQAYVDTVLQMFFPEIVMSVIGLSIMFLFFEELENIVGI